ncbi:MAG: hypothetical protein ABFE07_10790 [Armatimonadia bacterium]
MRRFNSPLFVLLVLVGLLGITVYAVAKCGGNAGACGMKSGPAACGMKAGCGMDAAKMKGHGGAAVSRTLGDVVISAVHRRGTTVLTVTTKSGRPSTDVVTAELNGQEVVLRPVGPGKYAFDGPAAGKLAVSVRNLWSTETASFTLAPGGRGCPMAGKCPGKAKACACGTACTCKPGVRSADCKCGAACKCGAKAGCSCGAGCKSTGASQCSGMTAGKCKQMGQCKDAAKAGCGCGGK